MIDDTGNEYERAERKLVKMK